VEVVVVDDGSTDGTPAVAARFPSVRYLRQKNQGMSAARNTGSRASRGRFIAFLDADDRLLPDGLRAGVECMKEHPAAAFVSGRHRMMSADGTPLPTEQPPSVQSDHYRTLLERNYVGMHATVLFRREALESVGGFDRSLRACDDYDVYLRIARRMPVACHEALVAEYRWHGRNTSFNSRLMIRSTLGPLRAQRRYVRGNPELEAAFRSGIRHWQRYYGTPLLAQTLADLRRPQRWGSAALGLASLLRNYPRGILEQILRRFEPEDPRRKASAPRP
jgi:glycosyltransferase involved in cell wall biosynthesis